MLPKAASPRESFGLILISFLLSMMLWLQVSAQSAPNKQREIVVRLQYENLGAGLFVTDLPDGVAVIAEGPEEPLERLEPGDITAVVDLSGLKAGEHTVKIEAPTLREPLRVRPKRPALILSIDRLRSVTRRVEVELQGQIADGLRFDGATTDPLSVVLSGPAKEIEQVRKVRAMLDLSTVRAGLTHQIDVEVLGADNVPLTQIEPVPQTVTVLPALAAAPSSKSLPIAPNWKGQPPFPFRVRSYRIEPNTVQLTGNSADLAKVFTVETEPIDLSSVRGTVTLRVPIQAPAGLSISGAKEVTITLEVVRAAP